MATYNGQEVGWVDEMFTTKERKSRGSDRPSPDPEPTPGNKAKRKKGQSDEPVVVAVTTKKADNPIDQSYNGFDLSWLEEPDEGIATKKWSAAARKAALAARRAKSRAKGGLGRESKTSFQNRQADIEHGANLLRAGKNIPDKLNRGERDAERLRRGQSLPVGTSPHVGAQRSAQKRSGSNTELGITSQNPTRSTDKGTTVAGASKPTKLPRLLQGPDNTPPKPTPKRNKRTMDKQRAFYKNLYPNKSDAEIEEIVRNDNSPRLR